MRNAIFVLALGIGAAVHFTHRLFPSLTSISPSAPLEAPYNPPDKLVQPHYLGGTHSGPALRPAVWTEESPSDSLPCLLPLVRRTLGAPDFDAPPSCQHLGEPTVLRGIGTASCQVLDSVPGRYCRF
jgi:hypothetical protein